MQNMKSVVIGYVQFHTEYFELFLLHVQNILHDNNDMPRYLL